MSLTGVPSVSQLLSQARAGDQAALSRLFDLCRNYMAIVARSQVESWLQAKVDASDLVQQTLLEAYRGFQNFQGASEGEWLAWLRRILHHNAADFVRHYGLADKRQAGREVSLAGGASTSAPGLDPADSMATPSQQLLRKENELQMADALTRLPPDYREVIVLRNLQRLAFDEVAERMGRSRPAAQMLWMRAMKKLQAELGATDDQDQA